jgi:hypothetical protein
MLGPVSRALGFLTRWIIAGSGVLSMESEHGMNSATAGDGCIIHDHQHLDHNCHHNTVSRGIALQHRTRRPMRPSTTAPDSILQCQQSTSATSSMPYPRASAGGRAIAARSIHVVLCRPWHRQSCCSGVGWSAGGGKRKEL